MAALAEDVCVLRVLLVTELYDMTAAESGRDSGSGCGGSAWWFSVQ